jgi:hypothetical protein
MFGQALECVHPVVALGWVRKAPGEQTYEPIDICYLDFTTTYPHTMKRHQFIHSQDGSARKSRQNEWNSFAEY